SSQRDTSLDVARLVIRFRSEHHGFKKLCSAYRVDKRTLAATSRSKKSTKSELEVLEKLANWKQTAAAIRARAEDDREVFGRFYDGPLTDCDRTEAALTVASRVVDLAAQDLSDAVRMQVSGGQGADRSLASRAAVLARAL